VFTLIEGGKMKSSHISEMKRTGTLKLTKWQLFTHYFLSLLPLSMAIYNFYVAFRIKYSEGYEVARTEKEIILVALVWLSLAILVFIIKKRRLRFKKIAISLTENQFKHGMAQVSEKEKWRLGNNTKHFATFYNGSWWTWGLKMTVLRFDDYLLINSICDSDRKTSISIFNENERNVKRLEKDLKELHFQSDTQN